jgi:CheY-like chemotaxis protein
MFEPISILLIDDDESFSEVIRHHLSNFQQRTFKVQWVNSSKKALEALSSTHSFDLI